MQAVLHDLLLDLLVEDLNAVGPKVLELIHLLHRLQKRLMLLNRRLKDLFYFAGIIPVSLYYLIKVISLGLGIELLHF